MQSDSTGRPPTAAFAERSQPRASEPTDSRAPVADLAPRLERISVDAVVSAAELVRRKLGRSRVIDTKTTPTDIVTEADVEVEAHIRTHLSAATPGAAFEGEEHGQSSGTTSIGWIVDPIDGTVNFLYDLPVMSVSIAATIEGEVVAGAVADVVRNEVFSASHGTRARRDGAVIEASKVTDLSAALIGTGFSYSAENRRREGEIAARLLPEARDIRGFGSSALHLCWVACGRLDGYYQDEVNDYDIAAGAFVARQAGARVHVDRRHAGTLIIAASPGIFDRLQELVTA